MNRIAPVLASAFVAALVITLSSPVIAGEGLDPAKLLQPPVDSWPTYNGDYSGRRFSPLTKINDPTSNSLSLAWVLSHR